MKFNYFKLYVEKNAEFFRMKMRLLSRLIILFIIAILCIIAFVSNFFYEKEIQIMSYDLISISITPTKLSSVNPTTIPKTSSTLRRFTPAIKVVNSENQSLEMYAANMTVLKTNHTHLHDFMRKMNNSLLNDDTLLIKNPHPFKYILNAETTCSDSDLFLIVYVHTAIDNLKRRMIIRQTWGKSSQYDLKIRVVFFLGISKKKDRHVQEALEYENSVYSDIVQEDFIDSYRNLTYKAISALKWIDEYCSHSKYVLKADDDMFVNMFTLLKHLKSLHDFKINNKNLILCLVWGRMIVMRTGKWAISEKEFPDKYYPTYCSGSAFVLSTDVAIMLHHASYKIPFFWVDDFYITGLLPLKLKLKHTQFMSTYVLDGRQLESKFTGQQWYSYIFSHVHDLNALQRVWRTLYKLANGIIIPEIKFFTSQYNSTNSSNKIQITTT